MEQQHDLSEVLEVASIAGHILLENGAEISRVEDIMARISTYYGVDKGNFFVLSNGIFTTGMSGGKVEKAGGQASTYANVEFIPIRPIQLQKVVQVNQLSYDISAGKCTLEEARARLEKIRSTPAKPMWEQTLGSAFGAAGFCAVFGGGWLDCGAAFVVGLLLNVFIFLVSGRYMSRIVGGICNALVATLLCVGCYHVGFGNSLANIIIGAIMPLIPGVPFVNGVRDLANADYLAGLTRLTDALLGFFCIAIGVSVGFILDGALSGGLIELNGVWANPETASLLVQTLAAFIGTTAFAVLFGVPRKQYIPSGIVGALGWLLYLILFRKAGMSAAIATLISTIFIGILSRVFAVIEKCPAAVFLLCGIFPLVPGAGVFWCTYYLISSQIEQSSSAGFLAGKVAIAIVLGIILAMELPQRFFSGHRRFSHEEEHRHTDHAHRHAEDFLHADFLLVQDGVGKDDQDGCESHQGGSDSRIRVLDGHQGKRYAEGGPEERKDGDIGQSLAVMERRFQAGQVLLERHERQESGTADEGADHRGRKRQHRVHEFGGAGRDRRLVMLHADLAEDEADTLSGAGAKTQQDAFQRQGQLHLMTFSFT